MTKQMLNWVEAVPDDCEDYCGTGLPLWVEDGTLGHCVILGSEAELPAALADYAAGYAAGDEPDEITVRWTLYRDGEQVRSGSHTWDYPIR